MTTKCRVLLTKEEYDEEQAINQQSLDPFTAEDGCFEITGVNNMALDFLDMMSSTPFSKQKQMPNPDLTLIDGKRHLVFTAYKIPEKSWEEVKK